MSLCVSQSAANIVHATLRLNMLQCESYRYVHAYATVPRFVDMHTCIIVPTCMRDAHAYILHRRIACKIVQCGPLPVACGPCTVLGPLKRAMDYV